jgi:hypothetical protein
MEDKERVRLLEQIIDSLLDAIAYGSPEDINNARRQAEASLVKKEELAK